MRRRSSRPAASGSALLNDFQAVFVNSATSQAAQAEASRSESALMDHLQAVSSGSFLQPANLPTSEQTAVTQASVDAHIKKAQAAQLSAMNQAQLQDLLAKDQAAYTGRRVSISVQLPKLEPIEAVWFDPQTGYRSSPSKKRLISGKIEEVLLDRNALIIKPSLTWQLLNSRLKNYVVYVIDPESLQPMVTISIS